MRSKLLLSLLIGGALLLTGPSHATIPLATPAPVAVAPATQPVVTVATSTSFAITLAPVMRYEVLVRQHVTAADGLAGGRQTLPLPARPAPASTTFTRTTASPLTQLFRIPPLIRRQTNG